MGAEGDTIKEVQQKLAGAVEAFATPNCSLGSRSDIHPWNRMEHSGGAYRIAFQ